MKIRIKKTIDSTSNVIEEKITYFLKDSGYRIVQTSNHMISFDDEIDTRWVPRSNLRYYKITAGTFSFTTKDDTATLSLEYNLNTVFETASFILLIVCAIYIDDVYFVGSLVIILSLIAKLYITKSEGRRMINKILKAS